MMILLSPSKTLDMEGTTPIKKPTIPDLLEESQTLIKLARKLSANDLKTLMDISDKLAVLNVDRFQSFKTPFTPDNAKPALFAFQGDVYDGLDSASFSAADLTYAQQHLRILSGLYGLLRPFDLMQAYRLEMGIPLANPRGKNLYQFWGDRITNLLNKHAKQSKCSRIVNLASQEYFAAIHTPSLALPLITPVFKEKKGNQLKVIGLMAKRARGKMAAWIIQNRVESANDIQTFDLDGYQYDAALSTEGEFTFTR